MLPTPLMLLILRTPPIILMQAKGIIQENTINYKLDSNIFSKDAIIKCIYWYTKNFNINLELIGKYFVIQFIPKSSNESFNLDSVIQQLNQDLIDYNLRDIVTKETGNIRDLITAKAFSNGEFDEEVPGELDDPIGFKFKDFL